MPGMQGNHLPPTEGPRLDSGTLKLFVITRSLYIFPSLSITGGKKSFFIPRSSINEGSNPQWSIELALRHSARVIIYSIFKV